MHPGGWARLAGWNLGLEEGLNGMDPQLQPANCQYNTPGFVAKPMMS